MASGGYRRLSRPCGNRTRAGRPCLHRRHNNGTPMTTSPSSRPRHRWPLRRPDGRPGLSDLDLWDKTTQEIDRWLRRCSSTILIACSSGRTSLVGRQARRLIAELVFICAAFHDLGLLEKFSSATDRFEVDSANAVRQFLEHHGVPATRIQTAWDAIALHTTPGIAAYKPLEVELLYNGVGLDVLGIGYDTFQNS